MPAPGRAGPRSRGPHPAVAQVRAAVRLATADLPDGAVVLVACSGGADSLALAAATAFVASARGSSRFSAGAVTVDHGLQEGSWARAAHVAGVLTGLGLAPVRAVPVTVGAAGGPEAAARAARYAALDEAAGATGAAAVLLGHTRDDQAESVLLGLARGSGARSLAGMAPVAGLYRRPLLDVARATLRAACRAEGLQPWDDPHNEDRAYARVRVRHDVLPVLEEAVGTPDGAVAAALARSAQLLRADADALDALAAQAWAALVTGGEAPVDDLAGLLPAVRSRVLRLMALDAGCGGGAGGAVLASHVEAMDALVSSWRGQGEVALPSGVRAARRCGRLAVTPERSDGDPHQGAPPRGIT